MSPIIGNYKMKSKEWTIIYVSERQEREILRYSIVRIFICFQRRWINVFILNL